MSKEAAADYFARHESSNECHITSDGRVFHTKGAADSFANGLKDTTVESFTRDGKKEEKEDEASGTDAKVIGLEDLEAFDAETATYAEIKELAKAFSLESVSQKKEDLLAAIEAHKLIMNTEIQD